MTDAKPTRRSILAMLGLAPFVAPTVAAAAAKPATMRFAHGSTPYLGAGRRILLCDEVDPMPWSATDVAAYRRAKLLTWPDGPDKDQVDQDWAEFMRDRSARTGIAREAPQSSVAPCPVLIDDVGSGP